jgi:hypothetical protein
VPQQRGEREPQDRRTSSQILAGLERWDLVIAVATTVVAAVAYLLPQYANHTFGSWEDYMALLAVGFLGSSASAALVLNWDLFPSLRSYRPDSPPKTPSAEAEEATASTPEGAGARDDTARRT